MFIICILLPLIIVASLNAVVVFNIEAIHDARLALKTTSAFNEATKKEQSPKHHEESILWVKKIDFFATIAKFYPTFQAVFDALPVGIGGESDEKNVVEW